VWDSGGVVAIGTNLRRRSKLLLSPNDGGLRAAVVSFREYR